MFSGKTEELIRRLKRAQFARQNIAIFKPEVDQRYSKEEVVSHDKNSIPSIPVASAEEIRQQAGNKQVVGIDEAQFFGLELTAICNELAAEGLRVIVAGLDMDYMGKPFGPMPGLLSSAEFITKVHAICLDCGSLANFSHRISKEDQQIHLGERNSYEPLCRSCFNGKVKTTKA